MIFLTFTWDQIWHTSNNQMLRLFLTYWMSELKVFLITNWAANNILQLSSVMLPEAINVRFGVLKVTNPSPADQTSSLTSETPWMDSKRQRLELGVMLLQSNTILPSSCFNFWEGRPAKNQEVYNQFDYWTFAFKELFLANKYKPEKILNITWVLYTSEM